jgi:hypothetical protein
VFPGPPSRPAAGRVTGRIARGPRAARSPVGRRRVPTPAVGRLAGRVDRARVASTTGRGFRVPRPAVPAGGPIVSPAASRRAAFPPATRSGSRVPRPAVPADRPVASRGSRVPSTTRSGSSRSHVRRSSRRSDRVTDCVARGPRAVGSPVGSPVASRGTACRRGSRRGAWHSQARRPGRLPVASPVASCGARVPSAAQSGGVTLPRRPSRWAGRPCHRSSRAGPACRRQPRPGLRVPRPAVPAGGPIVSPVALRGAVCPPTIGSGLPAFPGSPSRRLAGRVTGCGGEPCIAHRLPAPRPPPWPSWSRPRRRHGRRGPGFPRPPFRWAGRAGGRRRERVSPHPGGRLSQGLMRPTARGGCRSGRVSAAAARRSPLGEVGAESAERSG